MSLNNITSANASAILIVETLYPAGIVLEQFATDQSMNFDEVSYSQSRIGVDGKMVSAFMPSMKGLTITLEASSPSLVGLSQLAQMMTQNRQLYACTLVVQIPSLNKVFTYSNGVLESGKLVPDTKKVLEPVSFKFQFEDFKSSQL